MLIITKTYKFLKCGRVYVRFYGGLTLKLETPICPECGSKLSNPWAKLK